MNNELMTQIEALDDREYLHEWGTAKAMGDGIPVTAIKSLAAELTLANKKLAILQASNDHYAEKYPLDKTAHNALTMIK